MAPRASGVDPESLRKWIRKGEEETMGEYHQFAEDVGKAETTAETNMVQILHNSDDWRAAAWWLERRRPLDYGKNANKPAPMGPGPFDIQWEDMGILKT